MASVIGEKMSLVFEDLDVEGKLRSLGTNILY
jgi:hypothetical protein